MLPQQIYFDPIANKLINTDNSIIYEADNYPKIYVGEEDSIANVQLVINQDITQTFTDFKTGTIAHWITSNTYNNAYLYNLVKINFDLWTESSTAGEYYCNDIYETPNKVLINNIKAVNGNRGNLAVGEYDYSSSEKRIYLRIAGDVNPDTQPENFIQWLTNGSTPFIEALETKFNQPETWYDTNTKLMRTPDIEQGELSFIISADNEPFAQGINDTGEISNTKTQIQFYDNGKLFLIYEFKFRCLNRFMGGGAFFELGNPNIYTKREIDSKVGVLQASIIAIEADITTLDSQLSFVEDNLTQTTQKMNDNATAIELLSDEADLHDSSFIHADININKLTIADLVQSILQLQNSLALKISEAPQDGKMYARKGSAWVVVTAVTDNENTGNTVLYYGSPVEYNGENIEFGMVIGFDTVLYKGSPILYNTKSVLYS